jgi:hypothetical protein
MSASERVSLEPYGLGHGIGVTPEESPLLEADGYATIESGMCLVIRAALTGDRGLVVPTQSSSDRFEWHSWVSKLARETPGWKRFSLGLIGLRGACRSDSGPARRIARLRASL